jgi:hypothetical protein
MKEVGKRVEPLVLDVPSGTALASAVAFSAGVIQLAGGRVFFPKGVFRYKSHAEANEHQAACRAEGMARLVLERRRG